MAVASSDPLDEVVWGGLTRRQVSQQYDMRVAVPDGGKYSDAKRTLSEKVRAALPGPRDVPYGSGPRQQLDIYPAEKPGAPVLLYIHGGAWRYLDKSVYAFIAEPWRQRGVTCVLAGYGLLPNVPMDRMIAEIREAVAWTAGNAASFGGDPNRIVIAGMSAGAQLSGMALADPATAALLAGAVLSSGVYNMEPHRWHDRYLDMNLDEALVARASPLLNPPVRPETPLLIAVGAEETTEYRRQALAYADLCRARGHDVRFVAEPGRHHFSMGSAFGEPESQLFQAIDRLIATKR